MTRGICNGTISPTGIDPALLRDPIWRRAAWELRHARLRLALAENAIDWAQELLIRGEIEPRGALFILDEAMDNFHEVGP